MEFDEVAVEELFEEFDDVAFNDAGRGLVGLAECGYEGGQLGGAGEETPDVGAGFTEAEALAGFEGHEDDLGSDGGFDRGGTPDDCDLFVDSHSLAL